MSQEREAKLKALRLTMEKLDKTYGKGAVMLMGDKAVEEVEIIPSGSLGLDLGPCWCPNRPQTDSESTTNDPDRISNNFKLQPHES